MGKVIITGASGSIGRVVTKEMLLHGHEVVMACRNLDKAHKVLDVIARQILNEDPDGAVGLASRVEILQLDLEDSASIRAFVDSLHGCRVSAIFNNAGVINKEFKLNGDGVERTMAVNFLGPKLLTELLMPQFEEGAHIASMVSLACRFGRSDRARYSQIGAYADSKLALLRWAAGFAERNPQFHVNVCDPGIVNSNIIRLGRWFDPLTDIFFRPFISSPEKGARSALRALTEDVTMRWFTPRKVLDLGDWR